MKIRLKNTLAAAVTFFISLPSAWALEIPSVVTIASTGNVGTANSITTTADGHLAISFWDATLSQINLWIDDGRGAGTADNGLAEGTEIRVIDSASNSNSFTSIIRDKNSYLAISYFDDTSNNIKLWLDDGRGGGTSGDGLASGSEIRTIDSTGNARIYHALTLTPGGYLAMTYEESSNDNLVLWLDDGAGGGTAGDGLVNGSEKRTLITASASGQEVSIGFTKEGYMTLAYANTLNDELYQWIDDGKGSGTAGDVIINGTELRVLDTVGTFSNITLDANGYLAVSNYDTTLSNLELWVDDGRSAGTAGDGIVNGGEMRTIDSAGTVGEYASMKLDSRGYLAISYYDRTNFDLKFWIDDGFGSGTAGDGIANGTEIRTLDTDGSVGLHTSLTLDSRGHLAISYYDDTSDNLKLARITNYSSEVVQTISQTTFPLAIGFDANKNYLASYITGPNLVFWADDGNGGGTAGNRIAESSEVRTITTSSLYPSIGNDSSGRVVLAYQRYSFPSPSPTMLWYDDGNGGGIAGNNTIDGTELRTINSSTSGGFAKFAIDSNGRFTIASNGSGGNDLLLWLDDGRGGGTPDNHAADGTEIRTIDSTGNTYQHISMVYDSSDQLMISYRDGASGDIRLWIDDGDGGGTPGDGLANGTEIRLIDTTGIVGNEMSLGISPGGVIALSYYDDTNDELKLWVDDGRGAGTGGNKAVDGTEIRAIDSTGDVGRYSSLIYNNAGNLVVSYQDVSNTDAKLWIDDGVGGGTAGDGEANGDEIRDLDNTGNTGIHSKILLDHHRDLTIGYFREDIRQFKLFSPLSLTPEIEVFGNSIGITNGDNTPSTTDDTSFGSQVIGAGVILKTFTISNSGTGLLSLGGGAVTISGTNASDFSVTSQADTSVAASGNTTFTIEFDPQTTGVKNAIITITNNDGDESPFTFAITGTGNPVPTATPTATATATATNTATATQSPTNTATVTITPSSTPTPAATATPMAVEQNKNIKPTISSNKKGVIKIGLKDTFKGNRDYFAVIIKTETEELYQMPKPKLNKGVLKLTLRDVPAGNYRVYIYVRNGDKQYRSRFYKVEVK